MKAIQILREEGPTFGLHLNAAKLLVFWPSLDNTLLPDTLFQGFRVKKLGVKILGGVVIVDVAREFLGWEIGKVEDNRRLLEKLENSQVELMLLRICARTCGVVYNVRMVSLEVGNKVWAEFDIRFGQSFRKIVMADGSGLQDFSWDIATLPMEHKSIGDHLDGGFIQFCACIFQNCHDRLSKLFLLADSCFRQCHHAVLGCFRQLHVNDLFLALPIQGLGFVMGSKIYRNVFKYRLLPLFDDYSFCMACLKDWKVQFLDPWGDYALACKHDTNHKT